MPSATATLYLNVTAIQQLCKGDAGKSLLYGYTPPTSSVGLSGDFYINATTIYPPTYYDLYGPKNTNSWPATALRIPSTTLLGSVSSTLYSDIVALSAYTLQASLSSLTIANNNYDTPLRVIQYGSSTNYNVAEFTNSTGHLLTITNSATIAAFYADPSAAPAQFSINSPMYIAGNTTINGVLCATQDVQLGSGVHLYTGAVPSGDNYEVLTTNTNLTGITDTGFNIVSTFSVFLRPKTENTTPVRVHNTRFEVGLGDIFNVPIPNNGAYFIVDPVSAYGPGGRGVTIHGTLTSISAYSTNQSAEKYLDSNGAQLLTVRQSTPAKLTNGVSTSADIITRFNLLLDALTAHGLIR